MDTYFLKANKVVHHADMPKTRAPYPDKFKRRMVGFVRSGRTAELVAREFEPCAGSIRGCVKQTDLRAIAPMI